MSVRKSRSAKFFLSQIESFEPRMLLAAFATNPISFNSDFVGTTASVGPDGYTDVGLTVTGLLNKSINSIVISANTLSGPLTWAYGNNTNGLPYADFIRAKLNNSCNTYPYWVDYDQIDSGTIYFSPLTSLQFSNITVRLDLHDDITNVNYSENLPLNLSNSWSPTTVLRNSVSNLPLYGGSATFDSNQVTPANANATTSILSGDIHISATLPAGFVYGNLTSVSLSDGTNSLKVPGDANSLLTGSTIWSDNSSFGAYGLIKQASSNSSTTFDLFAPPVRNEAGECMTLTMVLNNGTGPKTYFTQFSGQAVDVTKYNKTRLILDSGVVKNSA